MASKENAKPGDETKPGSKQSAPGLCPKCSGTGKSGGRPCPACEGTGTVEVIVGDA